MNRNRTRIISSVSLAAIVAGFLVPGANATTVMYSDRTAFQSAVSGLSDEGFNTQVTTAPSVDFGAFSISVAFGDIRWSTDERFVSEGDGAIYGFDGTQPSTIGNSVTFLFDVPITSFGIDVTDHSSSILYVRDNGSLPETDLTTGLDSLFFGFTDTVPFYLVEIFWNNNHDAVGFDYLQYTSSTVVPVPATFWLFGSGLIGLAGMARKKGRESKSGCS